MASDHVPAADFTSGPQGHVSLIWGSSVTLQLQVCFVAIGMLGFLKWNLQPVPCVFFLPGTHSKLSEWCPWSPCHWAGPEGEVPPIPSLRWVFVLLTAEGFFFPPKKSSLSLLKFLLFWVFCVLDLNEDPQDLSDYLLFSLIFVSHGSVSHFSLWHVISLIAQGLNQNF